MLEYPICVQKERESWGEGERNPGEELRIQLKLNIFSDQIALVIYYFYIPKPAKDCSGLKYLNNKLALGFFKKNGWLWNENTI